MSGRRAFTLIEVLVVIAIISLLIGLVVPSINRARAASKRTACASNLRQVGVLMRTYLNENRDRLPYASAMPSVSPLPLETDEAISISDVFAKTLHNDLGIFACPADAEGDPRPAPNAGLSYFESERSSYEYRVQLGGRKLDDVAGRINQRTDRAVADNMIWILRDYGNFHGPGGKPGARRYLYVDGHVADFKN